MRHFLGVVENARRQTLITVAMLAVTGADLLPAMGSIFSQNALNGEMEWWSVDQISSWQDSLLWVPHHVASLLCCLLSFLLLWLVQKPEHKQYSAPAVFLSGLAFASAFGLSIYVAFGFALLMLALLIRALTRRQKDYMFARNIAMTGGVGFVMLIPFLRELTGGVSSVDSGASACIFSLSVRQMIAPGLLTGLPIFASWNKAHPVLLDQAARLVLLLPGLALELGFYGSVMLMLYYAKRKSDVKQTDALDTALYLAGWGLVMVLFIRSSVIGNNDFGYRASLLPQFFLLLLAGDLLASWWVPGRVQIVAATQWSKRTLYGLLVLGVAGTVYQAAMLRMFLPIEERHPHNGFSRLPAQVFEARAAFAKLDRMADKSAVVAFHPVDPDSANRGDVVSPYTFYSRSLLMNARRQILSAEPKCATEFGGDSESCLEIEQATARLYALPAATASWAEDYCRRFGVQYLVADDMDPVWADAAGWVSTLPAVASQPTIRISRAVCC